MAAMLTGGRLHTLRSPNGPRRYPRQEGCCPIGVINRKTGGVELHRRQMTPSGEQSVKQAVAGRIGGCEWRSVGGAENGEDRPIFRNSPRQGSRPGSTGAEEHYGTEAQEQNPNQGCSLIAADPTLQARGHHTVTPR